MKNVLKCVVAAVLLFSSIAAAQTWNLVWSDEFNGTSINRSDWTFDTGGGGWGNSELEYYTDRSQNATVANGNLLIIAKHESYSGNSYTSARLKSEGLKSFTYGKIVARIKLPQGKGFWPAFWMLGSNISKVGWPECGEIDIMEHINKVPYINGTMHWSNNGHVSYGRTIDCDSVTRYNTYSVEWSPDSIKWFLDGTEYCANSITNGIDSTQAFQKPFFILLNMAVGGSWPGSPDSTTTFPDTMFVDYVRVYQLATGIRGENGAPEGFKLNQNYPNPFNPTTTIGFAVHGSEFVVLSVYNVLGQLVKTLVDSRQMPGEHSVVFDGEGLASGVYFYRLVSGGLIQAKKMILLK